MKKNTIVKGLAALVVIIVLVFAGRFAYQKFIQIKNLIVAKKKLEVVRDVTGTARDLMRLGFSAQDRDVMATQHSMQVAAHQVERWGNRKVELNSSAAAQEAAICKLISINKDTIGNYKTALTSYLGSGLGQGCGQVKYAKKRIVRSAAEIAALEKKLYNLRVQAVR